MEFAINPLSSQLPKGKMNIAFCNFTRKWGGVKTWTIEFAKALQERGHNVFIYGREGVFVERARQKKLQAQAVPFRFDFNPCAIAHFRRDFAKNNIDVLFVNVGHDMRTAGVAALFANIPIVHRIGLPGDLADSFKIRLQHKILRPHYLCPCYYIRDGMLEKIPFIHTQDTTVIHSAKIMASIPESVHEPYGIVSTSQLTLNKGHVELAYTLALLKKEGFSFVWNIVGEGPARKDIESLCAKLGLQENTVFHGFSQRVDVLLQQNDIFVLSSYVEGLPNTLLEAMAHGLVPIARSVGGVKECWPPKVAELLAGNEHEKWKSVDWSTKKPEELPLYAPLQQVLSSSADTIMQMKIDTWEHCSKNFSLDQQIIKVEDFLYSIMAK